MQRDTEQTRIILDLLESVHRDGERSQRNRASEIGVALGLINAYLKIFIRKGYLKARKISARSYRYMLTPKGFREKSRLALLRLSDSLNFVRAIRAEFASLFTEAERRQWTSAVIAGASTLAEICALCALERGIKIVAIVDPGAKTDEMFSMPLYRDFASITEIFSGAVIADLQDPGTALELARAALGPDRVMIPPFLLASLPQREVP
jgi:hypothetical protein